MPDEVTQTLDSRSSASADALIEIDGVGDSGHGREDVKYAMEEISYTKFTGIRFLGRRGEEYDAGEVEGAFQITRAGANLVWFRTDLDK